MVWQRSKETKVKTIVHTTQDKFESVVVSIEEKEFETLTEIFNNFRDMSNFHITIKKGNQERLVYFNPKYIVCIEVDVVEE